MHHFTASDGERLHYTDHGRGSPLLFLHGWTSSHREWQPFADALADEHRCVCWDARGHGGHPRSTDTPNEVGRMARDIHELLDHLGLDRVTILGHSMGALTTWEYLRRYGCTRLARLVIVDQSPKLITDDDWPYGIYDDFSAEYNDDFIARMEQDFTEAVLALIGESRNRRARAVFREGGPELDRAREYLQRLDPEPLIQIWSSLMLADYRDVLPEIDVPTLLIHGDESHFYSLEVADYVRGRIPDAELHVYEGSDHMPHLWQRDRFLADIRAFCREPAAADDRA